MQAISTFCLFARTKAPCLLSVVSLHVLEPLCKVPENNYTALIVQGNEAEVFGRTYALIYDGSFYSDEGTELKTVPPKDVRFYFLRNGQKYDLAKRAVIEDPALEAQGRDEL
ncbi:unnamed protein product [Zymoseptoria tritici ST99CH_1A5]|uniref:Uncharacterized protein n=1 Tax=Zymoseptoria tritici ST99CH_1A5 TaxID=1276529 RepID=A0A1Y6M0B4_ZYMTR|nr:unnamed protein product [Zymoseptoria tritici ST99CH_1A5]